MVVEAGPVVRAQQVVAHLLHPAGFNRRYLSPTLNVTLNAAAISAPRSTYDFLGPGCGTASPLWFPNSACGEPYAAIST